MEIKMSSVCYNGTGGNRNEKRIPTFRLSWLVIVPNELVIRYCYTKLKKLITRLVKKKCNATQVGSLSSDHKIHVSLRE